MRSLRSVTFLMVGFTAGVLATAVVAARGQTASPGGVPDAALASPDHYKVEFENEYVKIVRPHSGPITKS